MTKRVCGITALKLVLSFFIAFSNTFPTWAQTAATPPSSQETYQQALVELEPVRQLLQNLSAEIDRSQFDLNIVIDQLNYDAHSIVQFVANSVYFEQYIGVLRGAKGTLMSRAGNALDQSLLLATLLKNAGLDARIVRGTLSAKQADTLVQQLGKQRLARSPAADVDRFRALLVDFGVSNGEQNVMLDSNLKGMDTPILIQQTSEFEEVEGVQKFLLSKLQSAGIKFRDSDNLESISLEAREYFWVEYRESNSASWTAAHPAFGGLNENLEDLIAQEFFVDQIPAHLQHRFRFSAVVEQKIGGKTKNSQIAQISEQPTANLIGKPFTFSNTPRLLLSAQTAEEVKTAMRESTMFFPTINGVPAGGFAFTLSGMVIPLDAAASSYAGVFETISSKGSSAAGALMKIGNSEAKDKSDLLPTLAQVWLEYTLISPGGAENTIRRPVLTGLKSLEQEQIIRALTAKSNFMLAVGEYPEAYVLNRYLERLIESLPLIAIANLKKKDPFKGVVVADRQVAKIDTAWLGHLLVYSAFDRGDQLGFSYRPEPSLVAYTERYSLDGEIEQWYDILNNERKAFSVSGKLPKPAPELAMLQGAWETSMEKASASRKPNEGSTIFDRARLEGQEILVLQSLGQSSESVDASDEIKELINRDLQSGFTVVVPASIKSTDLTTAWWRIDPMTGTALGMTIDGRGGAPVTVRVILQNALLPGVVFGACMMTFGVIMGAKDANTTWNWGAATSACAGLAIIVAPTSHALDVVGGLLGAIGTLMSMIGIVDS